MPSLLARWYLVILVIASPIPLGANRAWSAHLLLAVTLGVIAVVCLAKAFAGAGRSPAWPNRTVILGFAPLVLWMLWTVAQVVFGSLQIATIPDRVAGLVDVTPALLDKNPWLPASIDPSATVFHLKLGVLYLLVAALAAYSIRSTRHAWTILYAILFSSMLQAAIGFYEYFNQVDVLGLAARYSTPNGTFVNRNHFAGYVAAGVAIAIAILTFQLTRRREYGGHRYRSLAISWLDVLLGRYFVYLLLAGTGMSIIAISGSRGATAALVTAMVTGLIVLANTRDKSGRFTWGIFLGVIALILAAALYDSLVLSRIDSTLRNGNDGRLAEWRVAVGTLAEVAPSGSGMGTYTDAVAVYRNGTLPSFTYNHAHNHYLELAIESGLPGLILLGVFCSGGLILASRRLSSHSEGRALVAFSSLLVIITLLVHALVDFGLKIPALTILLHAVLGMVIGTVARSQRSG